MVVYRFAAFSLCLVVLAGCSAGAVSESDAGSDGSIGPDGSTGSNHAPVLARIGDKVAVLDEKLVIALRASDPDGDELEFSVFGELPEGAKFSKEEAEFSWTPITSDLGTHWMVTFSVSDGKATDRETISISVVATRDNSPPEFVEPGDQILMINQPFELLLEAIDPDGDVLVYQVIGGIPEGAVFDGQQGVFRWTPATDDAESIYQLLFQVSDGQLTDEMRVNLRVGSGAISFPPIEPSEVRLNESLELTLVIENPAGRTVTCTILGSSPSGSTFDSPTCVFRWTPTDPRLVGQTVQVVFQVSDGEVNLVQTASISVLPEGSGECVADSFEEIEQNDQTPVLNAGTYTDITFCNEDIDVFAVDLDAGQELVVTLTFEHDNLDLDLALFDPAAESPYSVSNGYTDTETIRVPSIPTAGYWLIAVFSEFNGSSTYSLTIEVNDTSGCVDDAFEENDSASTARLIETNTTHSAQYCAGDTDWYQFDADAGERLEIEIVPSDSIDLDLSLWAPNDTSSPSWTGYRSGIQVRLIVDSLPQSGTYRFEVDGVTSSDAAYNLTVTVGDVACSADAIESEGGNDTEEDAYPIESGDYLADLTFCEPDWFYFVGDVGQAVLISVNYNTVVYGQPTIILKRYGIGSNLGIVEYDAYGAVVTLDPVPYDDFYTLGITSGDIGMAYSLEILILDP